MLYTFVTPDELQENTYLYVDEKTNKALLFDPGDKFEELDKLIEKKNIEVKAIVLTHAHSDHIKGVPYYREKFSVDVYGPVQEKELFEDPKKNLSYYYDGVGISIKDMKYLENNREVEISPFKFTIKHAPGHTKGSSIYVFDDLAIVGDVIFRGSVGRWDLYSGSFSDTQNSILNVIYKLDKQLPLYPGHGEKTNVEFESKYNAYFRINA